MELKELKDFSRVILGIFLIAWPLCILIFTFGGDSVYNKYLLIICASLVVICLVSLILSFFNSQIIKVAYWGNTAALFLVSYSFYLFAVASTSSPENNISQLLLVLNPFIIIIPLLFRRLILKRPSFIEALKSRKHQMCLISDLIIAAVVGLIVIFAANKLDNHLFHNMNSVSTALSFFITYCVLFGSVTACVYSLSFYVYEARFKTFQSKPKARR